MLAMVRAVSANLGRRRVAGLWLRDVLARTGDDAVDLLFLQEVPLREDWARIAESFGFEVATDLDSAYSVRSMLLWRADEIDGVPFQLPTAGYHGSYLAAARLTLPGVGEAVAVSVHASPTVVAPQYQEHWLRIARPLPEARSAAAPGELWDSDFVLCSLGELARMGSVVAAGDYNECLAWDDANPGEWGREYFARVTDSGLVSLTHRDGGVEQQSAFTHEGLEYQLDHVLATPSVADRIAQAPRVDPDWSRERVIAGEISDHAPLWFEIA
jgi:endonuclease/exonuclease/phosphatase family metal-dependent hydrolase